MTIALPDPGLETISDFIGVAGSYWVYRCPNLFATWFWIKRYFPDTPQTQRVPPPKFVKFFRIIGLIGAWGFVLELGVYCILWATGEGVIGLHSPAT